MTFRGIFQLFDVWIVGKPTYNETEVANLIAKRISSTISNYVLAIIAVYVILTVASTIITPQDMTTEIVMALIWLVGMLIVQAIGSVASLLAESLEAKLPSSVNASVSPDSADTKPEATN